MGVVRRSSQLGARQGTRVDSAHRLQLVWRASRSAPGGTMPAAPLMSVAKRLLANVDAARGDFAEEMLYVPTASYRDQQQFDAEMEAVFRQCPLLVALSVDVAGPSDFS